MQWQRNLAVSFYKLERSDDGNAPHWQGKARAVLEDLARKGRLAKGDEAWLDWLRGA